MIWTAKKTGYRFFQGVMKLLSGFLRFREPELLTGKGCVIALGRSVKERGVKRVLVVTDKGLMSLNLLKGLLKGLEDNGVNYVIFDEVHPNPTIGDIEVARRMYLENHCEGVIAFGGGSPMDCGKMAAARVTNENLSIANMRGLLKVRRRLPPLFAVPTTAGTGSETTAAAVVTDTENHEKYAVMDLKLTPAVAALDPELTLGLPKHITSTTGMDALTHAVEAYIGRMGTAYTDKNAEEAVKIIFDNLEKAYNDGNNIEARNQMILASYKAGNAFTRAYVGYVHAIAHALGGLYGVPHGLANSVVLPYVLDYFGSSVYHKLARLAILTGIGKDGEREEALAKRFIAKVRDMNRNMNIPKGIKEVREEDIKLIVKRALKEANPMYPVPKIMNEGDCWEVVEKLIVK